MIAVDSNILVYAHREDSAFHDSVFRRLSELAQDTASWAIPWPCLHEFLAVVTHPRICAPPSPLVRALDQVDAWIETPSLTLLAESSEHWTILRTMLTAGRVSGAQAHDARIAALCRQRGVRELWSADRDFNRFSGLLVVNPLVEGR